MNLDKLETGFAPLEQSLSYDLTSSGSEFGFKPTLFEPFKMPSMEDMILRGQKRAEFE